MYKDYGPGIIHTGRWDEPKRTTEYRKIVSSEYSISHNGDWSCQHSERNPRGNHCYNFYEANFDYQHSTALALSRYKGIKTEPGDLDMIIDYFGKGIRFWQSHGRWFESGWLGANLNLQDYVLFIPRTIMVGSDFRVGTSKIDLTIEDFKIESRSEKGKDFVDNLSYYYYNDPEKYDELTFQGFDISGVETDSFETGMCNEEVGNDGETFLSKYPELCKDRVALHMINASSGINEINSNLKNGFDELKNQYSNFIEYNTPKKRGVLSFAFEFESELDESEGKAFIRGKVKINFSNMFIRLHLKHDEAFHPWRGDSEITDLGDQEYTSQQVLEGLYEGLIDENSPPVGLGIGPIMAVKSKHIFKFKDFESHHDYLPDPCFETTNGHTCGSSNTPIYKIGGLDNGIGILVKVKEEPLYDLYMSHMRRYGTAGSDPVGNIAFFRPYNAPENVKTFRVSPMIYENAPFNIYYIPQKEDDKLNGIVLKKVSQNNIQNDPVGYYKIEYAKCADEYCTEFEDNADHSKGIPHKPQMSYYWDNNNIRQFVIIEDIVQPSDTSAIMVDGSGSRLVPLSDLDNNYHAKGEGKHEKRTPFPINCHISKNASPNVKETIGDKEKDKINSKIYAICNFPEGKNKIDLVVMDNKDAGAEADTQGTNFKYELAFKPVYGEPVGGKQPVIFEWVNDVSRKPDHINKLVDAFDSQDPDKVKMYGLVIGENGLENYYYKINFIVEENVSDRNINIYANKEIKGINGFDDTIHIFFENQLVAIVGANIFIDNTDNDFFDGTVFTKTWSEMKRFYDDLGREVKFKVVRDLGEKNDREAIITIGYTLNKNNSLIELIDPFVSADGADEVCDGSIYCTLENFIETDEFKNANQAQLEPLSKIECKGGDDSVDYLCFASSTSDWDFIDYSGKCVKTQTFRNNIIKKLQSETTENISALDDILKLPLQSEGKTTHLYQWCMPKYEFQGEKRERSICEVNDMTIINDVDYTCELCVGNTIPNDDRTQCDECPVGKIADPSDGTCKDVEDIVVPPDPDEKCTKGVENLIANTCSCPSDSRRVENSDSTKFMCLSCEEGFEPNPDDFGKCISTTDLELIRKIKECLKLAPIMEWKDNACVLTNKALSSTCPSNVFIVTDRNKDCLCADGTAPVIDSVNGSGQCASIDPNVVTKGEGGGCSLGSDKVNSIMPFILVCILFLIRKRKTFVF